MADFRDKAWMVPVRYTDDQGARTRDAPPERTAEDVEALIARNTDGHDVRGERPKGSADDTPIDYSNRGDRERDLDLDDREYDSEKVAYEYVPPAAPKVPRLDPEIGRLDRKLYETEKELIETKTALNEFRKEVTNRDALTREGGLAALIAENTRLLRTIAKLVDRLIE